MVTERSAAAARDPDLPKIVPPATKSKLALPRRQRPMEPQEKKMPRQARERPPLRRRRKVGAPPTSPTLLQGAPDGDAMDPANCACAAAGPAYEENKRFDIPAPPKVTPATRILSPPPEIPAAAAAGPEYDPTKRFPKHEADYEQRSDATMKRTMKRENRMGEKTETRTSESSNIEFELNDYYSHESLGDVKYLGSKVDDRGRLICCVRVWKKHGIFENHWVPGKD